jgi:hypothetical protein
VAALRITHAGFSNDSIVTIALMVGLAAGLEATGVLNVVARIVLGRGSSVWLGQVGGLDPPHSACGRAAAPGSCECTLPSSAPCVLLTRTSAGAAGAAVHGRRLGVRLHEQHAAGGGDDPRGGALVQGQPPARVQVHDPAQVRGR